MLFADESGGNLHRGTIRNRLRRLMELEGRPPQERFSPHALRRACATHNYERGVDLVAIQQLLGHWTVSSTMRYVNPRELHQTGEKLGRLLSVALEWVLLASPLCGLT